MPSGSPRSPLGCRLAGFMRPAARSCRSFATTSMTSWLRPRRMETPLRRARQTGPQGRPVQPLAGRRPHLPRNWREIGVGDLVVTQEGPEDGWYEAIVVEAAGDMLTLRWRDYPRERRVGRHRLRLGLLYPRSKLTAETGKSAKALVQAKHDKAIAANRAANAQSLPRDWDDIDIGHLVLAKAESRWPAWWEAIVVENADDLLKLRWRDNASTPPITRPRFDLALICPDAA